MEQAGRIGAGAPVPAAPARSVVIVGHSGAGKTSLADALLHAAGAVSRAGRVDQGTSVFDYDPAEQQRRMTLSASVAHLKHGGCTIHLVDTPGYFDFAGEVRAALRVADAALVVVDGAAGVQVGTQLHWKEAQRLGVPRLVFVNKLDREHARFAGTLEALRAAFGAAVVPLAWPLGERAEHRGAVDLLADGDAEEVPDAAPWIARLMEAAAEQDDELLERYLADGALEADEVRRGLAAGVARGAVVPVLCGSALAGTGLEPLLDALARLVPPLDGRAAAVGGGAAAAGAGPAAAAAPAPNPGRAPANPGPAPAAPFRGLVFKTIADPFVGKVSLLRVYSGVLRAESQVWNASRGAAERIGPLFRLRGREQEPVPEAHPGDIVAVAKLTHTGTGDTLADPPAAPLDGIEWPRPVYRVAVEPKAKGDEDRIGQGLARLMEEDPTFVVERDAETHQTVLSAMGDVHVEVIAERLKRKFGVDVTLTAPRVAYRETIRRRARGEGKHKKQTGGHGQYGHCILEIEPLERGAGFEFVDRIYGGAVPRQYIPAVEKGVRETMQSGVLAGYPVVDVRVTLLDGSHHPVDSSEMAFKIAASLAFKQAFAAAQPVLLEPILQLEVLVPEEVMGDVLGDLNKKRGRILGLEPDGALRRVRALVPEAEALRYAIDLRSLTQGRGAFSATFSHYEEAPPHVAQGVLAAQGAPERG
ncbi:MAG: elongation factor G [Firmicutes bacterium]|nr:elongation factor G [Bacillota bacterium]